MFQGVLFYAALLLNQMCKCWQQHYLHSICDAVLIELDCSINGKHIFLYNIWWHQWKGADKSLKTPQLLHEVKPVPAAVTYCLWRCQSYISLLLTGSISQSRLTEQAFELYSLLLLGNETEMTVQLWRGWVGGVGVGQLQVVSVLPNTPTLSLATLCLLQIQSSRELQAGEPPGGAWRGAAVTLIQFPPRFPHPPGAIFKLE